MRRIAYVLLACALLCGGCATTKSSSTATSSLSASDAVSQLAGATTAISALVSQLPSTGPTAADADTVAHIEGYAAWTNIALQALGIVAKASGL